MHTMNFCSDFTPGEKKSCDKKVSELEVTLVIKSFSNNKSLGNNGLTKEMHESF